MQGIESFQTQVHDMACFHVSTKTRFSHHDYYYLTSSKKWERLFGIALTLAAAAAHQNGGIKNACTYTQAQHNDDLYQKLLQSKPFSFIFHF